MAGVLGAVFAFSCNGRAAGYALPDGPLLLLLPFWILIEMGIDGWRDALDATCHGRDGCFSSFLPCFQASACLLPVRAAVGSPQPATTASPCLSLPSSPLTLPARPLNSQCHRGGHAPACQPFLPLRLRLLRSHAFTCFQMN